MPAVIIFDREDDGRWIAEFGSLLAYGATRTEAEANVMALVPPSHWRQPSAKWRVARAAGKLRSQLGAGPTTSYMGGRGVWVDSADSSAAYKVATTIGRKVNLQPMRFQRGDRYFIGYRAMSYPKRWF